MQPARCSPQYYSIRMHGPQKAAKLGLLKVGPEEWPVLVHQELQKKHSARRYATVGLSILLYLGNPILGSYYFYLHCGIRCITINYCIIKRHRPRRPRHQVLAGQAKLAALLQAVSERYGARARARTCRVPSRPCCRAARTTATATAAAGHTWSIETASS